MSHAATRILLAVLVCLLPNYALAQDPNLSPNWQPDFSTITTQSPYGFWYPSSFFSQPPNVNTATSYQGVFITGLSSNPPILGHFDKNGKVVNGDYVLVLYLDLDTAPVTKVWFNGLWATVDESMVSGTPTVHEGQPLGQYEFALGATNVGTQIQGTQGTVYLGIALLTKRNENLDKAWGATMTQVIQINDTIPGYPYGNYIFIDGTAAFSTASFTQGGAAHFKKAPRLEVR